MDVDLEHTLPPPIPSSEYLAAARLSIEEFVKPRLSKLNEKDDKDPEASTKNEKFHYQPSAFQKGKFVKDPNAPDDKGYFILFTITLFGLVHMLPIMFFFTANEYWMYKFRNTTSTSTDANDRSYMQKYFSSLTTLTITTPGVICNFIAAIGGHKVKATTRLFFVLFVHSTVLIVQAIFVMIDTDNWQAAFFGFVLVNQLIMSCAGSLGGSGSMGLIAKLPPRYMKAKMLGEGVSGVFSALLRLISIFVTPSTTSAALMYFVIGSLLMVITTIIFYIATKTEFFRYYTRSSEEDIKENLRSHKEILEVVKLLWPLTLLAFFGMLVPYGAISNLVVSEYNGTDNVWGNKYFVTVCTYVIPAVSGLIGRALWNKFDIDLSIPTLYVISLTKDVIFGVLLFLSNAKPRKHLPVIVNHDWEYALINALQSLTTGFMMNLNMMKSMRMVPPNRIELSLMIMMFFFSIFAAATSPLAVLAVSLL